MMGLTVVGKAAATVITSSPSLIFFSLRRGEVRAENANKFADAIIKLLGNKNERYRLVKNSSEFVKEMDWTNLIKDYIKLIDEK